MRSNLHVPVSKIFTYIFPLNLCFQMSPPPPRNCKGHLRGLSAHLSTVQCRSTRPRHGRHLRRWSLVPRVQHGAKLSWGEHDWRDSLPGCELRASSSSGSYLPVGDALYWGNNASRSRCTHTHTCICTVIIITYTHVHSPHAVTLRRTTSPDQFTVAGHVSNVDMPRYGLLQWMQQRACVYRDSRLLCGSRLAVWRLHRLRPQWRVSDC